MRKLTFMISALIALAGCGNSMGGTLEEVDSWEEDMMGLLQKALFLLRISQQTIL